MEGVTSTVSLKERPELTPRIWMPRPRALAIGVVAAILFRVAMIAILSLIAAVPNVGRAVPALGFLTSLQVERFLPTLDALSYIACVAFGARAVYWALNGQQNTLLYDLVNNAFRNRSAVIGMAMVGVLIMIADRAPNIATHDPILSMIGIPGEVPPLPRKMPCVRFLGCEEPQHIMGLDLNARDIYSRVIFGSRTSLTVGFLSVVFSVIAGTVLGLTAGYASGWTDNIIMRIMDVLLAFPSLLLAIVIVTVLGPGLQNALLAIAIVAIPAYARLARASTLSVKELEFVTAERALGASPARIMLTQVFPNTITPIIVQGTLGIGTAVLDAAALSFLGLGAQPPTPEWGQMLSEARAYLFIAPHMVFFPGIAIMVTVLGFNLLGDGMRDAMDPRVSRN